MRRAAAAACRIGPQAPGPGHTQRLTAAKKTHPNQNVSKRRCEINDTHGHTALTLSLVSRIELSTHITPDALRSLAQSTQHGHISVSQSRGRGSLRKTTAAAPSRCSGSYYSLLVMGVRAEAHTPSSALLTDTRVIARPKPRLRVVGVRSIRGGGPAAHRYYPSAVYYIS